MYMQAGPEKQNNKKKNTTKKMFNFPVLFSSSFSPSFSRSEFIQCLDFFLFHFLF